MQLKDVMTRMVEITRPDAMLRDAASKMRLLDIGPLPVCEGARVVGILTDRDITIRATAEGLDPRTTAVADVMTKDVYFCYEDQDVEEAAKLMSDLQVRRLLVFDRDSNLAGIVSLGDIVTDTGDEKMAGRILHKVSEPDSVPLRPSLHDGSMKSRLGGGVQG